MEVIYLLKLFKKNYKAILSFIVLFTVSGIVFYFLQSDNYEASMSLYVKRGIEAGSSDYYSYDGYYASQVAKEYTDTVVGFFENLDVLKRAGEITREIPSDLEELNKLSSQIKVSKEAPQIIKIVVVNNDRDKAIEIIKGLSQAGIERVMLLNQTGDPYLSVDVIDSEPVVLKKEISLLILMGGAFISSIVISFCVVLLIDLFEKLKDN